MESFKEFEGRSLDEAISEACSYFDTAREKLEIDIMQDAKSGIFGLVGARKAKVRARRVQLRNAVDDILGRKESEDKVEAAPKREAEPREAREPRESRENDRDKGRDKHREQTHAVEQPKTDAQHDADSEDSAPARSSSQGQPRTTRPAQKPLAKPALKGKRDEKTAGDERRRGDGSRPPRPPRPARPERADRAERAQNHEADGFGDESHEDNDDLQRIPFEDLDQQKLCALSLEVVAKLVTPIVGELPLTVELRDSRVNVRMDCGEDSGLLIGREGQTLASLQYLASRMVSRGMNAAVRVQLDAGEYRVRQDEKLREMALGLAEKVRTTGKSLSTRPLSSYHRRIVHLALQEAEDVQTRSSGDGPLKRVVIQRRKG